jgi:pyrroline-5-carboxylate reductase
LSAWFESKFVHYFIYLFIDFTADGAVRAGLPRAVAMRLASRTVLGAAQLQITTGKHPGELKDQVGSPGGTTMAGVGKLEEAGFRGIVMGAVGAAADRARELGAKK